MKIAKVNKSLVIQENATPDTISPTPPRKSDLKNIIQLTEQYDPNPANDIAEPSNKNPPEIIATPSKLSFVKRYITCFSNLWRYLCYSPSRLQLDINDSDFATVISRIKNKKKNYQPVLPPQTDKNKKKVLVLDLDQTLIHTSFSKPQKYDYQSEVMFNGRSTKIYTVKRFGLESFLFEMSKLYEIVIFTASQKLYADKVIDLIDPKKRISHRLYREHCIVVNKSYYLKNLSILGRNIKQTIIVDVFIELYKDNNIAGILQPENFCKIQPFEGNEKDRQLCRLSAFLKHIHSKTDILPVRDLRKKFQEMEINLQQQVISQINATNIEGRSLDQRKRLYKHKKTNSQVETLVQKNQEVQTEQTEGETTASDLVTKKF